MKEYKPQEMYRTIAGPLETEEQLEQSNADHLCNTFNDLRERFGIKPKPITQEEKDKALRSLFTEGLVKLPR